MRARPVVLTLVFLLAVVAGVGIRLALRPTYNSPAGWCCITTGTACSWQADITSCKTAGGQLFDQTEALCNAVCLPPV